MAGRQGIVIHYHHLRPPPPVRKNKFLITHGRPNEAKYLLGCALIRAMQMPVANGWVRQRGRIEPLPERVPLAGGERGRTIVGLPASDRWIRLVWATECFYLSAAAEADRNNRQCISNIIYGRTHWQESKRPRRNARCLLKRLNRPVHMFQ